MTMASRRCNENDRRVHRPVIFITDNLCYQTIDHELVSIGTTGSHAARSGEHRRRPRVLADPGETSRRRHSTVFTLWPSLRQGRCRSTVPIGSSVTSQCGCGGFTCARAAPVDRRRRQGYPPASRRSRRHLTAKLPALMPFDKVADFLAVVWCARNELRGQPTLECPAVSSRSDGRISLAIRPS